MSLVWYGERGVLNALVVALAARPDEAEQWRSLLEVVMWVGGNKPPWVTTKFDSVNVIVELGLSDFGNPDLIVVAKDENGETNLFLVEAKIQRYDVTAAL